MYLLKWMSFLKTSKTKIKNSHLYSWRFKPRSAQEAAVEFEKKGQEMMVPSNIYYLFQRRQAGWATTSCRTWPYGAACPKLSWSACWPPTSTCEPCLELLHEPADAVFSGLCATRGAYLFDAWPEHSLLDLFDGAIRN